MLAVVFTVDPDARHGHKTQSRGFDRTELLEPLFEALRRTPELRHRWRDDDVVAWDNLVTQHFACFDFEGERRVVHTIDVR